MEQCTPRALPIAPFQEAPNRMGRSTSAGAVGKVRKHAGQGNAGRFRAARLWGA